MGLNVEQLPEQAKGVKLPEGTEINLSVPFTYTIGEEGYHSNKILVTFQDCVDELRAEVSAGVLTSDELMIEIN